jgi:hypothetical protein
MLSLVAQAAQSKTPISMLAKVGNSHAAVARSTVSHDSASSLSHAIAHNVLPVLAACFGGVDHFTHAFVGLREVSHALKSHRASLRQQSVRAAMRSLTAHLALSSIFAWAGSLQSLSDYDRMRRLDTHDIAFAGGHITTEPTRVVVAHHVSGPKKPVSSSLRQLLDFLKLDIGTASSRLSAAEQSFSGEGIGRTRSLRDTLRGQFEWLWQQGAFLEHLPRQLIVFIKLSADCGKLARFSLSKGPLFCDIVSVLPDPTLFSSNAAHAVSSPLLLTLATENDTIAGVCGQAKARAAALLSLVDPILLYNDEGDIAHELIVKV